MPAIINTNINSLNAQRNVANSQQALTVSIQRLSSGLRVNSAKDDAAGLAIAERFNAQVKGNNVAVRNANDGISLSQTAEGALSKVTDSLQRMRELAVQARNATNTASDKTSLDQEFGELAKEIQRVLGGTTFNNKKIVGADAGDQVFQVGANTTVNDSITITTKDFTTEATVTAVAGTDQTGAGRAVLTGDNTAIGTVIDNLDTALKTVNSERAVYGATQNRFDAVISNLMISVENQAAARSRIVDADFAVETANLSRAQILQQAGTAMLAQANAAPQGVLALLRGCATEHYFAARSVRAGLRRNLAAVMAGVDLLALPTTAALPPVWPFEEDQTAIVDEVANQQAVRFSFLANLTGLPAGTAPAGMVDGLPVGLQLVGDAHDEASVIAGLAAVERLGIGRVPDPDGFVPLESVARG
jgi:flagellin